VAKAWGRAASSVRNSKVAGAVRAWDRCNAVSVAKVWVLAASSLRSSKAAGKAKALDLVASSLRDSKVVVVASRT
jgi:hypothetical protein